MRSAPGLSLGGVIGWLRRVATLFVYFVYSPLDTVNSAVRPIEQGTGLKRI